MDWINHTASRIAAELVQINKENADDFSVSGFGLRVKVERLIRLLRTAMYPNI